MVFLSLRRFSGHRRIVEYGLAACFLFLQAHTFPQSVAVSTPAAVKMLELSSLPDRAFTKRLVEFWESYNLYENLYVINYGTDREIHRRERIFTNALIRRSCFPDYRITLVRGGPGKGSRTVVWSIPDGADNPAPY